VTRLVNEVVLAEAGLAGTNLRWRAQRAMLQWGAVGATACAVVAAGVLAWHAYAGSRDRLDAAGTRLPALAQHVAAGQAAAQDDPVALLPTLDLLASFAAAPRLPRVVRAGFDMGLDRSGMLVAAHATPTCARCERVPAAHRGTPGGAAARRRAATTSSWSTRR
jgi:type VI protein secretion system component VasK